MSRRASLDDDYGNWDKKGRSVKKWRLLAQIWMPRGISRWSVKDQTDT
jgi:hypothetical protein